MMTLSLLYNDLKQAVFPTEKQFHVLKHFTEISKKYRQFLINNSEYSSENIESQLKEKGSRFFKTFASDPLHLRDVVIDKILSDGVIAKWEGNRCEILIDVSKKDYPEGIGEDHIVHIDRLPVKIKNKLPELSYETLQKFQYNGHPKKTWTINLIIHKVEDHPVIITIFPGIYAPLLPNREEQSKEEYNRSMEFWCKHVLIS